VAIELKMLALSIVLGIVQIIAASHAASLPSIDCLNPKEGWSNPGVFDRDLTVTGQTSPGRESREALG
jgi:hypothetical protein